MDSMSGQLSNSVFLIKKVQCDLGAVRKVNNTMSAICPNQSHAISFSNWADEHYKILNSIPDQDKRARLLALN